MKDGMLILSRFNLKNIKEYHKNYNSSDNVHRRAIHNYSY